MKKMKTVLKKDTNDLGRVIKEIQCDWVYDAGVKCYAKFDGTACMIKDFILYKRYDAKMQKNGEYKTPPASSIPCCDPDSETGHWPHWTPIDDCDKWHHEALRNNPALLLMDGTYELIGPKIQNNRHTVNSHVLIDHLSVELPFVDPFLAEEFMSSSSFVWEGIIYRHIDGRMSKIRKKDFGLTW